MHHSLQLTLAQHSCGDCAKTSDSKPNRQVWVAPKLTGARLLHQSFTATRTHAVAARPGENLVNRIRKSLEGKPGRECLSHFCSWDDACASTSSRGIDATSPAQGPAHIFQGAARATGRGKLGSPCQDRFLAVNQSSGTCSVDEEMPTGLAEHSLPLAIAGVFDGHGVGEQAPIAAKEQILQRVLDNSTLMDTFWYNADCPELSLDEILHVACGFSDVFGSLDEAILRDSYEYGHINGTTALLAIACGCKFYCSNAGDSRAVLCENGRAVRISRDHTPGLQDERARIEGKGGRVVERRGAYRVMLINKHIAELSAVSRALGDRQFKDRGLIVSEPDISAYVLQPQVHRFVICASDGLWCVVSDQEAVDAVEQVLLEHSNMQQQSMQRLYGHNAHLAQQLTPQHAMAATNGATAAVATASVTATAAAPMDTMSFMSNPCADELSGFGSGGAGNIAGDAPGGAPGGASGGGLSTGVAKAAAQRLLHLAQERGSLDDITVIVNLFDWSA